MIAAKKKKKKSYSLKLVKGKAVDHLIYDSKKILLMRPLFQIDILKSHGWKFRYSQKTLYCQLKNLICYDLCMCVWASNGRKTRELLKNDFSRQTENPFNLQRQQ